MTLSQIAQLLNASEKEVRDARQVAGVDARQLYDGRIDPSHEYGDQDITRIHAQILLARGYDPQEVVGCQASDPITPRAIAILGWLIGQGGKMDEKAFEDRLARRHVDDRGTVGVSYACIGHNVLFRRGFLWSCSRTRTINVSPQGQAYFDSI